MEHEEDVPEPQAHAAIPPDADAHHDAWFDEPADGPAHHGVRPSRRNVLVAAVGAVAIAAAAVVGVNAISSGSSSATAASATRNGPGGRGGPPGGGDGGTIQSVNGSTIVVKNRSNKTETVQTSASTTVTEAVKGSLSDVKVGDHVVVLGSTSGSSVTASQIVDNGTASNPSGPGGSGGSSGPPGGQQAPNGASGSSSSGSSSSNGPSGSGGPPSGPSSQSGSNPSGSSAPSGNGPPGGAPTMGTVTAVNGSTITVQTTSGSSVTVSTSASTTVLVTKTGSVSDLTVGEQIMVRGTSSNGTITATSIREGDFGPPPGAGSGNAGGPGSSS